MKTILIFILIIISNDFINYRKFLLKLTKFCFRKKRSRRLISKYIFSQGYVCENSGQLNMKMY